jgi:tRNA G10  N-methylase Trm11
MQKEINEYWNFDGCDTKEYTHCFHIYPAMMIPQIARELLEKYCEDEFKVLFDPYCGTGTSLVEGSLRRLICIGIDLNPLARLISKVKTQQIDINNIIEFRIHFLELYNSYKNEIVIPKITNINYWFKEKQLQQLSIIKRCIDTISVEIEKEFFLIPFSETLREVSLTRNNEFKLYRIPKEKIEQHNPDTLSLFLNKVDRNINGYKKYMECNPTYNVSIYDFDSSKDIPNTIIPENFVDIVITSPPYGDSRTTVAYGQFSTLSNEWMGIENARKLDSNLMGGLVTEIEQTGLKALDNIIFNISLEKPKRAKEIYSFYRDYKQSIFNVSKTIKHGGIVAYVVGNRRVNDIELPTDEFTKYCFESQGFKHIETIVRNIPNKRQPKQTSPTNKKGKKVSTMNYEYIVILKKE